MDKDSTELSGKDKLLALANAAGLRGVVLDEFMKAVDETISDAYAEGYEDGAWDWNKSPDHA